jgi:hypothetical protein
MYKFLAIITMPILILSLILLASFMWSMELLHLIKIPNK